MGIPPVDAGPDGVGSAGRVASGAGPRGFAPGWILGSWQDALLFFGTPLLILPVVAGLRPGFSAVEIGLFVAVFGATGHHLPGLMRAYGDRELFERFRARFLLAPVLLLTTSLILAHRDLDALSMIVLVWGTWHGLAQVYGIGRIYDVKVGSTAPLTVKLDLWICIAWFGAGFFASSGHMETVLRYFYASGGPVLPGSAFQAFRSAWFIGTGAVSVAFLANLAWRWRRGERANPIKLALMVTSFAFWWYAMVSIHNIILGIALFELFHDVQYLSITWVYNRNRVERGHAVGALTRFLFRRNAALIGVYVGLVLIYGYVVHVPRWIEPVALNTWLSGLVATSALLHFYYDGFIWKVRERGTRESLGLRGGAVDAVRGPGLRHALKWSLFFVPIAYLWLVEPQPGPGGSPIAAAQARSLVALVPESAASHVRLGVALREEGRRREGLAELREAASLEPEWPEAQLELAATLASGGDHAAAIEHYRSALRVGRDAWATRADLAASLQQEGRLDEAIEELRAAVRLAPRNADLRYNLGYATTQAGRFEEAVTHYRAALERAPDHWRAHYGLGVALARLGRSDEAQRHQSRARALRAGVFSAASRGSDS